MGLGRVFNCPNVNVHEAIIADFKYLQHVFETSKKREAWSRKYFPSLKFIAVKLLEKHGIKCNFDIPFIRTKRKQKALDIVWSDFS